MKIEVKWSRMVKPTVGKASSSLWLSNLDIMMPPNCYTRVPLFYRSTGVDKFFESRVLEVALSRALVELYPMAGRLQMNKLDDRLQINCNGEGALFVEAESDGTLDDLGDFAPRPDLSLTPKLDHSQGISAYPLLLVQVTRFKCGGVCLGIGIDHVLADGLSIFNFINIWSAISRGLDNIPVAPSMDRRVLAARNPPHPHFDHLEYSSYQLSPTLMNTEMSSETIFSIFKLTRHHLNALKDNCQHQLQQTDKVTYSTYEVLAGHVWRVVTKARALAEDEESRLYIPVEGRSRIQPPLPPGYLGNVVFQATCRALCGELQSNPLEFAVRKIHGAIARMDDEYLRSAIDFLELGGSDPGSNAYKCPNLAINSWARFPFYDVDFGWGKPLYMGFCEYLPEGLTVVQPSPANDGSLLYAILLPKDQMQVFEKLLYQII